MRVCLVCKKELPSKNKKYCSRECLSNGMKEPYIKECIICSTSFTTVKTSQRTTCSYACNRKNRSRVAKQGLAKKMSDKAKVANANNPKLGRFDTHIHAKKWVVKSPDGQVYECRNLLHWLRENAHLIDGTPIQAWSNLAAIKAYKSGRSDRVRNVWKGWTVLEWDD